jgi:hypothetical protein
METFILLIIKVMFAFNFLTVAILMCSTRRAPDDLDI